MVRALIMTHGQLGAELVRVVELILGPVEGLSAQSNNGRSLTDLTAAIKDWLNEVDEAEADAVIFVDDYGGSCATAAQLAGGPSSRPTIISGVNLAMVLGFVTWRETGELAELAERLVRKGREAITQVGSR